MGRAASFPEIQAKPVISPEERPTFISYLCGVVEYGEGPRLHRGEQGARVPCTGSGPVIRAWCHCVSRVTETSHELQPMAASLLSKF